jgi:serine/threonine protein kinase
LRSLALIPATPDSTSILNVVVREPNGGLTRSVAAAVAGNSGVDVVGYRDHRGVRVVGAWRWLPELDLGIVAEVPLNRAFGALRPLRLAFGGLFTLLAIAAGVLLFTGHRVGQLQSRMQAIQRVGQYTLEEKIGEGGMGIVYKARHALLRRPTAVKLLKGTEATAEAVARFEQEVQLTSQLTHPNTVEIYDFGRTAEGVFYYAMELLPGLDLARLIELDGPQPPARSIHILRQVCAALSEAHGAGLIHRDIKPLNIILSERGGVADFVKVLDFGLVKQVMQSDSKITVTEAVHGTPLYVPPERLRDPAQADARTDIYAVGCVAFNLLTGQDPYQARTTMELCYHVLNTAPPRAADLAPAPIPEVLDTLVNACLAKDPDQRPRSIDAMAATLAALAEALPWEQQAAKRWWRENADRIHLRPASPR